MPIDFTMPPEVVAIRDKVRAFVTDEIEPADARARESGAWRETIIDLRRQAIKRGLCWYRARRCSANAGTDACLVKHGWGRRGWRIACAGSAMPKWLWKCS